MDAILAETGELQMDGDGFLIHRPTGRSIDVIYERVDEDTLYAEVPGLLECHVEGKVHVLFAPNSEIIDDKGVGVFVPEMVRRYLGEEPLIENARTWSLAVEEDRRYVMDHFDELVVKSRGGYGGKEVMIGPEETREAVERFRRMVEENPVEYVAQETIDFSTHVLCEAEESDFLLRDSYADYRVLVLAPDPDGPARRRGGAGVAQPGGRAWQARRQHLQRRQDERHLGARIMNYGDLIGDAFRITLRNRYLWFFGFFAGGSTSSNFPTNVPSGGGNFNPGDFQQSSTMLSAAQVGQGLGNGVLIAGLVVVALILALFFIFMAVVSQGALADSVAAIERGDRRGFGSTFRSGLGNFWRVLGYIVVFFLIGIGLLLVIGIPVALLIGGTFAATQSVGARITVAVVVGLLAVLAADRHLRPPLHHRAVRPAGDRGAPRARPRLRRERLRDLPAQHRTEPAAPAHTVRALHRDRDRLLSRAPYRGPRPVPTDDRAGRRRLLHGRHSRRRSSGRDPDPTLARGDGRHRHLQPLLLDARLPAPDGPANHGTEPDRHKLNGQTTD